MSGVFGGTGHVLRETSPWLNHPHAFNAFYSICTLAPTPQDEEGLADVGQLEALAECFG